MAVNDESQSSFTPAGTGQMARARGDSRLYFRKLPKYLRAERIEVPCLTLRQYGLGMWRACGCALHPRYRRPAKQGSFS